jgi:hypothetical protein
MTAHPLRALRRIVVRTVPAGAAAALVTTGLITPARPVDRKAVVSERVHSLAKGPVGQGWSKTAETGHSTELVGFEWQGNHDGAVEVRVKQNGGWGDWQRVEGDPAEGPDEGSHERHPRTTAGPLWVGRGVRQVEVRVAEGTLAGLRLHALHSEEPKSSGGTEPAGGAVPQPGMVSRAGWGADESYRSLNPGCGRPQYAPVVRFAVVHHTVNPNNYTPADSASMIRGIYYFHTHTNGWCDIGYNFLVDRFGTVFEGRFGGVANAVVGAHAQGFNTGSTGVALLGSFQADPVPSPMYDGLRTVLAWKLSLHEIDPTATIAFNGRQVAAVSGHRDLNATECPGNIPYGMLPQLRSELVPLVGLAPKVNVRSAASGKLMDVSGGSQAPGTTVIQWSAHGGPNQQWRFEPLGGDLYKVVSVSSGQVLDVAGGSTAAGADVIQWPWHGGSNQQWRVVPLSSVVPGASSDVLQITSARTGMALDVSGGSGAEGAHVVQWPWHGGPNQQWARVQVG